MDFGYMGYTLLERIMDIQPYFGKLVNKNFHKRWKKESCDLYLIEYEYFSSNTINHWITTSYHIISPLEYKPFRTIKICRRTDNNEFKKYKQKSENKILARIFTHNPKYLTDKNRKLATKSYTNCKNKYWRIDLDNFLNNMLFYSDKKELSQAMSNQRMNQ